MSLFNHRLHAHSPSHTAATGEGKGTPSATYPTIVRSLRCQFGFGSVPIPPSPNSVAVCYSIPSIPSQRRRFGFIWLQLWWRLLVGQRRFRLHLASVSVATPALGGIDLGLRSVEVPISSRLQSPPVSLSYAYLSYPSSIFPHYSIPSHPCRSIPFHPFRPVLFGSNPWGLRWLWLCFIFDLTRGLDLGLVRFRFGFSSVPILPSPNPARRVLFVSSFPPQRHGFGFIWLRFRGDSCFRFCSYSIVSQSRASCPVPSHPSQTSSFGLGFGWSDFVGFCVDFGSILASVSVLVSLVAFRFGSSGSSASVLIDIGFVSAEVRGL